MQFVEVLKAFTQPGHFTVKLKYYCVCPVEIAPLKVNIKTSLFLKVVPIDVIVSTRDIRTQ